MRTHRRCELCGALSLPVTAAAAGCSHAREPVNHFRNANNSNVSLWEGQSAENGGRGGLRGRSARRCCSATWCWSPVPAGHRPDLPPGASGIPGSNLAPRASRSTLRRDTSPYMHYRGLGKCLLTLYASNTRKYNSPLHAAPPVTTLSPRLG